MARNLLDLLGMLRQDAPEEQQVPHELLRTGRAARHQKWLQEYEGIEEAKKRAISDTRLQDPTQSYKFEPDPELQERRMRQGDVTPEYPSVVEREGLAENLLKFLAYRNPLGPYKTITETIPAVGRAGWEGSKISPWSLASLSELGLPEEEKKGGPGKALDILFPPPGYGERETFAPFRSPEEFYKFSTTGQIPRHGIREMVGGKLAAEEPTPEVPAPDIPTKTEPSGEEKVDVKSTDLPGMGDDTYQKWVKDSERLGIPLSEHIRNEIAREMGLEKSDINEKISQLSQRLLEALDRKPGWPEILMAWGLMLMGQDGVGFVQQINQARLGQVSALQRALQGAEGERGRVEALGAADQQAQMTRATALQKEQFGRREKTLSNLIAATGRTSAEFSKYLRAHADFGGTKLKALLGYPGTAKERMDLTHIRKMAEMAQMLLTEYPAWATTLSLSQLLEAAKAKLKEQPIEVTG